MGIGRRSERPLAPPDDAAPSVVAAAKRCRRRRRRRQEERTSIDPGAGYLALVGWSTDRDVYPDAMLREKRECDLRDVELENDISNDI